MIEIDSFIGGGDRWIALTIRTGFRIVGGGRSADVWFDVEISEDGGGGGGGGGNCLDDKSFHDRLKR